MRRRLRGAAPVVAPTEDVWKVVIRQATADHWTGNVYRNASFVQYVMGKDEAAVIKAAAKVKSEFQIEKARRAAAYAVTL